MRKVFLALVAALGIAATVSAKTLATMQIENGGPGPYKTEVVKDSGLPGYTIIRPIDMKSAVSVEGRLPVILFGNGGCTRDVEHYLPFLVNIASQGYVIVSNGVYPADKPAPQPRPQAAPAPQARPAQTPEEARQAMMDGFKKSEKQNVDDALDYLRALDYLQVQNNTKKSEYYQMLATDNVAAMGQSCGGGQALILGSAGDPRIRTTVPLNSGVAYLDDGSTWMNKKEDLQKINHPICYIIGGPTDVAYPNSADDYKRISHVPVAVCNLNVGHMATYAQPGGGAFADMAILWLDYQLKGKVENEPVFRYSVLPESMAHDGWKINSKNFDKPIEMHLWDPVPSKETARYNDFGEVTNYSGVNDPTITVYLPDRDKANGTAVLLYPGGAMVSLSWDGESYEVARWLNSKGIAAIAVKYRLKDMSQMTRPAAPTATDNVFLRMQGKVYDFGLLNKANTNPQIPDPNDRSTDNAADDANRAIEIVKAHAAEWGIDPNKIGELGFSAGGGVELAALMKADKAHTPAFIGTLYGPSLVDIDVPENAPELFVAVHADHPNVAAGCLALYMEWKKAGADAEIHIYEKNTGNFFGSAGSGEPTPYGGDWKDAFYSWMCANGFVKTK